MKIKNLAIDAANDRRDIAAAAEALKKMADAYVNKYNGLMGGNDAEALQLEEATGSCLHINVSVVSTVKVSTKELVVQFF